ncbi:hypothetical protein HanLR1_Chr04g0149831 [Helianthus annuus]|nr:hypothetical protein HanHA89_Chr04g0158131 [Helianthus annuus]KAJ0758388.1 hypothetical protein HanLR1_Chr04g0149831 [Helianthus annuus]
MGRGRNKATTRARGTSLTTPLDDPSRLDKFDIRLTWLLTIKEKEHEMKLAKQIVKDLKFLEKDLSYLSEEDQAIFEARKAKIRAKYM